MEEALAPRRQSVLTLTLTPKNQSFLHCIFKLAKTELKGYTIDIAGR